MKEQFEFKSIKKTIEFEDVDRYTLIVREFDNQISGFQQQVIKYYKSKNKKILSRLTNLQLKNLIERCNEIIEERNSNGKEI